MKSKICLSFERFEYYRKGNSINCFCCFILSFFAYPSLAFFGYVLDSVLVATGKTPEQNKENSFYHGTILIERICKILKTIYVLLLCGDTPFSQFHHLLFSSEAGKEGMY